MELVTLLEAPETDAETFADAIENFAGVSIVIEHKTVDVGDELRGLLRPISEKKDSRSIMVSRLFSI